MNKLFAVLVLSLALLAAAADTASMAAASASTPAVTTPAATNSNAANSNGAARKVTINVSLRSKCLTAVANLLTANLKACKDRISNPKFANCKQTAYNIAKLERAACPTSKSSLK